MGNRDKIAAVGASSTATTCLDDSRLKKLRRKRLLKTRIVAGSYRSIDFAIWSLAYPLHLVG